MNISITSRHLDVTEAIKAYAGAKINGVLKEDYPRIESIHVILDIQKFRHFVEVVIQAGQHIRVEAKEESDDMYKSIDKVADKISRQLLKIKEKKVEHKSNKRRTRLADFEREIARRAGESG
ncbi:MAG: ribosome-associated translation inhibitor RaiA [Lentisphaerae bacterium]|nr:ribosome-associated translation inhibitor RaiA [Lentisphaerota bacterium]